MKALFFALVPITLLGLLIAAQSFKPKRTTPITLIVSVDTSGSAEPFIPQYANAVKRSVLQMKTPDDQTIISRFDTDCKEFLGPDPILLGSKLMPILKKNLVATKDKGTQPHVALEQALKLAEVQQQPTYIILLTDGGNDNLTANADESLSQSAKVLAKLPHVKRVIFAGTIAGSREKIRSLLAPLGSKLAFKEARDLTLPIILESN